MWKPLFLCYFLLIATMTKTMFVKSQQLLFTILFICEVITLHKINIWYFYFFLLFSFLLFSQDHSNKAKYLSQNYSLLYISRTRLHRGIIRQNSKLDHTKIFILLDQDITKRIELRKTVKIEVWWWYDTGAPPPGHY